MKQKKCHPTDETILVPYQQERGKNEKKNQIAGIKNNTRINPKEFQSCEVRRNLHLSSGCVHPTGSNSLPPPSMMPVPQFSSTKQVHCIDCVCVCVCVCEGLKKLVYVQPFSLFPI